MKTKIYLLTVIAALMLTGTELSAQARYGLHAGFGMITQAKLGTIWNNTEVSPGYFAGGFVEYPVKGRFSLQAEINYESKGDKTQSTLEGSEMTATRHFNYLSVPLVAKGTFGKELGLPTGWSVTGIAGPYAGFLTSAKSNINFGGNSETSSISSQAEKTDFGLLLGMGIIHELKGSGAIVGEIRYEMGLKAIDKQDSELRNKGLNLTIGYRF